MLKNILRTLATRWLPYARNKSHLRILNIAQWPKTQIRSYAVIADTILPRTLPIQATADIKPVVSGRPLPPPSVEQQVAIDTMLNTKNNLIVDAMAGSGKTTTILHLAQAMADTNFLVLVYNRRLMLETQARVEALRMSNVSVFNYHTLGARYYTPECATDQGLKRIVEDDMSVYPGMELPDFSVLVMDEQQDLTPILKRFIDKIIRDKGYVTKDGSPASAQDRLRIVCLGDRRQEIYSFNNADSRFLTMAGKKEIFGYINDHPWTEAQQTSSNRVTEQNVDFINQQLMRVAQGKPMRAVRKARKDGSAYPKPRYVIGVPAEATVEEVKRLLYECNVKRSDIIILAPSTRGKSPAKSVANQLALDGIPVHRADSDITDIPPEVMDQRVLICTYHQAKGIERPACIVLGFDQSYNTHYDKTFEIPVVVSNPQYVAATRAVEHLVLIHDHEWAPLPFMNMKTVNKTCDVILKRSMVKSPKTMNLIARSTNIRFNVTGLCRNLSESLITKCLQRLEIEQTVEPFWPSPPPAKAVKDKYGLPEGVAHITGTSIPALLEWWQTKKLTIIDNVKPEKRFWKREFWRDLPQDHLNKVKAIQAQIAAGEAVSVSDILYISSVVVASMDGDITKLVGLPLDGYTWMTEEYAKETIFTLDGLPRPANITKTVKFETEQVGSFKTIEAGGGTKVPETRQGILLLGVMDVFRPRKSEEHVIWEIKHIDTLQPEHLLQVVLYMLLARKESRAYLVSARTGHTVRVTPRSEDSLLEILQILVSAKSGGPQARLLNEFTDEEFLNEARRNFGGIVGKCALPSWFSMRPRRSRFDKRSKKSNKTADSDDI